MTLAGIFPAFIVIAISVVISLTEIVKAIDVKGKLRGVYIFAPIIFSAVVTLTLAFGKFFEWRQAFFWWAVIFSLSVSNYELWVKKIRNFMDRENE